MDYVLLSDLARWYVVVVSGWLACLMLVLTAKRLRRYGFHRQRIPHPATTIGFSMVLTASIFHRFDRLGEPGDLYLWGVMLGVSLAAFGVMSQTEFTVAPPWRRESVGSRT